MADVAKAVLLLGICCGAAISSSSSLASNGPTATPVPSPTPSLPPNAQNSTATSSIKAHTTAAATTPLPTSTLSPSPTPGPPPEVYRLLDSENKTCILMNASILVNISYLGEKKNYTLILDIGNTAQVDEQLSICNRSAGQNLVEAQLTIEWSSERHPYYLGFIFRQDTQRGRQKWWLHLLQLNFTSSGLVNYTGSAEAANFSTGSPRQDGLFSNEYQRSYLCRRATNIVLNSTANGTVNSSVAILEWQVQAFEFLNDSTFGNARSCIQSTVSNVVPIAVGVALAVLIIVVLAAYIFGRIRSRRKTATYEKLS